MSTKVNGIPLSELCGYEGARRPELVREAFSLFGSSFSKFRISGSSGEKPTQVMLWRFARKVLGKDVPNIPQETGDCVSWGARNAAAFIQFLPILNGRRSEFHDIFAPHIYGVSRVQIGGGRIWGEGSVGAWAAKGVLQYGVIASDGEGVPAYSGAVAKSWGRSGPPQKFLERGKQYLVGAAAQVTNPDEVDQALENGFAVTVASNQGFNMEPNRSGFHEASGVWPHQMAITGFDRGGDGVEPHYCVQNSWGDLHGRLKDFRNPDEEWPIGTLRVRRNVIASMLRQGDSFAYSLFAGFPAQPLPREAFALFG